MTLTSLTVSELLAAFRSTEPTPGGGSASALSGAVGASLLAMVAGLANPRAESEADVAALRAAGERCASIGVELEQLIDRDAAAYDGVVAAFRLPKASDAEKARRTAAIQEAMKAATEAPLEVMRRCADALAQLRVVATLGNPNASSDVEVAAALLGAGLKGAQKNVEINLPAIKDEDYVARVRLESEALASTRAV